MPTYKQLAKVSHPDYQPDSWKIIHLLYKGFAGCDLAEHDDKLVEKIFPRYTYESKRVWRERVQRSFIVPYLGQVIDQIVASLTDDPVKMHADGEVDPFYELFYSDVAKSGMNRMSLNQLLRKQICTALLCEWGAWTLVDLPDPGTLGAPSDEPISLADQEAQGMLRAYAVPLDPLCVRDWEIDENGELVWALVHKVTQKRKGLDDERQTVREEFTYYTAETWERFAIEYIPGKSDPKDDVEVPSVSNGPQPHSFGRVPMVRLLLPDGLHAGAKIKGMAIEHFNRISALSWAQYKSLFQFLVIKLQAPDPMNPQTENLNRGLGQALGDGRAWLGAEKDDVQFCGPNPAPFEIAMKSAAELRDEIFRVLHHMALAASNSAASKRQSGEAKRMEQMPVVTVQKFMGECAKEHAVDVYQMVACGRQDPPIDWAAEGMDSFAETGVEALVEMWERIENISIPSPTFQRLGKRMLAQRLLGDVSDEDAENISKELETNITMELFDPALQLEQQEPAEEKPAPQE